MSQAGIVDIIGTHPEIPTLFVCNVGSAVPIANTLEILGTAVAAHSIPLETVGSGNTVQIEVQYASAAASSVANNAGVASFNSTQFTVDANGYVTISGGSLVESFNVDAHTAPGTNPVVPNGSGVVTVTGGQVAAGTTANVIQTNSLAANTYTIQVQRSQAVGVSTVGDNGVCHFNSTYFTVDSNGFVSINGASIGETITGNTGGALSPTAGNWNILGTSTAAGSTPVQTSGSVSTLTIQVQKSQAIAATDATKIGLAAFDSARFTVDSNGFVSLSGTGVGETITGNSGGALSPTAGNWNIVGAGSITTSGSVSTLTIQLTGLTNHAVQVGGSGTTLTQVGPSATTGAVLASNGATSDPSFQTISSLGAITSITGNSGGAEVPLSGNFNILGTGSITVAGSANTETVQLTGLTNHNVLVGAGTATITNVAPSATSGVPLISNGAAADPSFGTAVVAGGGTGATSFTAHSLLLGQGTSPVTALGAATNGQIPIGSTGVDPVLATITQGTGISVTNGAGSITIAAAGGVATTYTEDSGTATPSANNLNVLGSGSITTTGSGSTITTALTGLTNHNVLVGAGTSTITKVAPSATSGVPLISQGSSSDPTFGTAVVGGGGTGATSFTAYSVVCAGTTSTGAFQNVSGVGTSGQVLTSNGAGALPTWQASAASGSLILLNTQTASNSANITFNSTYITSTYKTYVLVFDKIVAATGSTFKMLVSTDNGSTYKSTGYLSGNWFLSYNSATVQNQNATTFFQLWTGSVSSQNSGTLWMYNFGQADLPAIQGDFWIGGTYWQKTVGNNSNTGINNIQLLFDSGNISSGIFSLYGVTQ